MKFIDVHFHLFNDDLASLEKIISDYSQVASQIWIQEVPWNGTLSHGQLLEVARKHGDYILPFALIDPRNGPEQIEHFADEGFKGVKVIFPGRYYDDESMLKIYQEVNNCGMVAAFHTGGQAYHPPGVIPEDWPPAMYRSKYMHPSTIDAVAKEFPGMNILMLHSGGYDYRHAYIVCDYHPNVFICVGDFDSSHGGNIHQLKNWIDSDSFQDWSSILERTVVGFDRPFGMKTQSLEGLIRRTNDIHREITDWWGEEVCENLMFNNAQRFLKGSSLG